MIRYAKNSGANNYKQHHSVCAMPAWRSIVNFPTLTVTPYMEIKRGQVWLANLNPGRGTEPGKTRPVLVIQNQHLLDAGHPSTLIAPLTTQLVPDAFPLRHLLTAQDKLEYDSDILFDQIRAIDNQRLVTGPLTHCPASVMQQIDYCLQEVLGL
jgi:mRNA interferase MazF